jgi:hypothetical protein
VQVRLDSSLWRGDEEQAVDWVAVGPGCGIVKMVDKGALGVVAGGEAPLKSSPLASSSSSHADERMMVAEEAFKWGTDGSRRLLSCTTNAAQCITDQKISSLTQTDLV